MTEIDRNAWYLMITVPHLRAASARVDTGSGWQRNLFDWLSHRADDPDWFDEDTDEVTLETLQDWANEDVQTGAIIEVPQDAPATREQAQAILDALPIQAASAAEVELCAFWGDRYIVTFDDLYDEEEVQAMSSNIIKPDITGEVIEKMLDGDYIGYWILATGEVYASTVDSGAYPLLDEEWESAFGDIDLEQSPEVIAQLIREVIDTTWEDTLIAVENWQAKNEEV